MRVGVNTSITAIPPGGTVGQILLSTDAQNYSWQYPPTAASDIPFISGQWLDNNLALNVATPTLVSPAANTTYFSPVYFPQATTIIGLAIVTGTTWSAGGTVNLRVYDSASSGGPGNFLGGGSVTTAALQTAYAATTSVTVAAGWNFLAAAATATVAGNIINFRPSGSHWILGDAAISSSSSSNTYWISSSGSSLPSGAGATMSTGSDPLILYRVA